MTLYYINEYKNYLERKEERGEKKEGKRERKWLSHNSIHGLHSLPLNMLMAGAIKFSLKQALLEIFT